MAIGALVAVLVAIGAPVAILVVIGTPVAVLSGESRYNAFVGAFLAVCIFSSFSELVSISNAERRRLILGYSLSTLPFGILGVVFFAVRLFGILGVFGDAFSTATVRLVSSETGWFRGLPRPFSAILGSRILRYGS